MDKPAPDETTGQLVRVPNATTIAEMREMAKAAAASGLFPALKTPESILTLMLLCQAEGLHPIQALRRYDIVQGRPALKADAMLGEFQARGGRVEWKKCDATACVAVFTAPGIAAPVEVTWTMADAQRAGLAGKAGPWQQYPRAMLRARVISEGVRMSMPGVVVGIYTPEEVQDFEPPAARLAPVASVMPPSPADIAEEDRDPPGDAVDVVTTYEFNMGTETWEPVGEQQKASKAQVAKIHILMNKLGHHLDRRVGDPKTKKQSIEKEGKYRQKLRDNFGKESTAELTVREASRVLDWLEAYYAKLDARLDRGNEGLAAPAASTEYDLPGAAYRCDDGKCGTCEMCKSVQP